MHASNGAVFNGTPFSARLQLKIDLNTSMVQLKIDLQMTLLPLPFSSLQSPRTPSLSLHRHHHRITLTAPPSQPKTHFAQNLKSSEVSEAMLLVQRVGISQMLEASKFGFVLQLEFPYSAPIPFAPLSITEEISKPNDEVAEIDEEGEEYSVYCKIGKRGSMEDRYSAVVDLQGDTKQLERITNLQIICVIKHKTTVSEYEVTEAVREGYLATDSEFLNEDINGGTCCVTALIRKGNLIVSNAGDCRAVMSRGGVAEALTVDHKPSRNDEKDRIEPMVRTYNDFDPKHL
ncbi:hypothetical protein LXL04_033412 [Taraxacum kok-saghyz]